MLPFPLFRIFGQPVYMYGIMIAVGILGVFLVLYLYGRHLGVSMEFLDFSFYTGVGAIVAGFGAAALFQATYNYIEHPELGFRLGSGITVIGGLIGGIAFFVGVYWLYRLYHHLKKTEPKGYILQILSIAACCICIAQAFGRVGCFFGGCCYGVETDCFLGVKFPLLDAPVHPTQLYEAAFFFILFGILSFLTLRYKYRYSMSIYLVAYGIFRFLIEFVRNDDRGAFVGGISPSQFWSIGFVVGGVVLYILLEVHYFKQYSQQNTVTSGDGTE